MAGEARILRLLRLLLTSACLVFWLWLRGWPLADTLTTAIALAAAAAALSSRKEPWFSIGALLVAAVTLVNLAAFYGASEELTATRDRFQRLPRAQALLAASALWALGDALFSAERPLASAVSRVGAAIGRRARGVVYGISLAVIVVFTADLYFFGAGSAFDYQKHIVHPVSVYPADYAKAHATERFIVDTYGDRFSQAKPPGTLRIIMNGASTMFGHLVTREGSPPGVLRRLLSERFPDRRFEVICMAWAGKYQLNELVESSVYFPHWQPDLVLSFNGFNEIWYAEDQDRFEGMPYWHLEMLGALAVPPEDAFFYQHSQFGAQIWRSQLRADPPLLQQPALYEPPRYYGYLRSTARALAEHAIPYVYAFCPTALEKQQTEDLSDPELVGLFSETRQRRRLSRRIVEGAGQLSYDVMAPLSGMQHTQAFVDSCHLTPAGTEAIMADLVQRIPEWLDTKPHAGDAALDARVAPLRLTSRAIARFLTMGAGYADGLLLRSTGEVGLLQGGPLLDLPAGGYRARWYGRVEAPGKARADIVALDAGKQKTFAEQTSELRAGRGIQLIASVEAKLPAAVQALEYRLSVASPGLKIAVERIIFEEVRDE